jgi:iduronate 2-sulfatase
LIKEVEERIKNQQGERWNRELFENNLMGYTLRTDRYRLVAWLDYRNVRADPLYLELYDHVKDPMESRNVAEDFPKKADELLKKLRRTGIGRKL